jgi:hypothetical protein
LKALIKNSRKGGLQKTDVQFIASIMRDAEKLEWGEGQLERRKKAVQTFVTGQVAGLWREETDMYGLLAVDDKEDEFLKKHGWNRVDSGFRLWGGGNVENGGVQEEKDEFLRSKGWNKLDSGFRII